MITLVGIGHVFDLRKEIEKIIASEEPDLVCVELDKERYESLLAEHEEGKLRGVPLPYIFLARFQRRIAKLYGVSVGSEMLTAIKVAREKGIRVELIDVNVREMFTRLWESLSFKEKLKLFVTSLVSLFVGKKHVERELKRFQENEENFLKEVARDFPVMKRAVVDERNEYMARKLKELSGEHEKIVAIVGDGHVMGIEDLLRKEGLEVKVIRLRELIDFEDP